MPDTDVEALVLLIEYSEQEAVRLRISPVVVHCLRMASDELKSTVRPTVKVKPTARVRHRLQGQIELLQAKGFPAIYLAAYFSLLSSFQIGFRDLSVGNWLARVQPDNFALEAVGWARVVSGLQSILSVYLVAMWLLTTFGRPFQ